jgi:hypothetical protein
LNNEQTPTASKPGINISTERWLKKISWGQAFLLRNPQLPFMPPHWHWDVPKLNNKQKVEEFFLNLLFKSNVT